MNTLSFHIIQSIDSNDHEVRILVDENDLLGDDKLGLDPPVFFEQQNLIKSGQVLIGRCTCGVMGCNDYPVDITVSEDRIIWANSSGLRLEFDKSVYEKIISTSKIDFSWESKERRAERLTSAILKNTKTADDFSFDWTSARIEENIITVSYSKDGQQKLFAFNWDGQTEDSAVNEATQFLNQEEILNNC